MIGISLSPEQVRAAPPEVRRWLEHEIGMTFGLAAPDHPAAENLATRLVGCNPDEAAAILAAENLMLAAYAHGLGACWIGFAQRWLATEEGRRTIKAPEGFLPVAPIIAGHPGKAAPAVLRNPSQIRWVA